MKAVICTKYGPPEVLQIVDIPKPIPNDKELLVRIKATTAHIGDTKIRRFEPGLGAVRDFFFKPIMRFMIGFRGPRKKILGMEFSGDVESIGKNVTKFKPGDSVFATTEFRFGTYAEYCCISEDGVLAAKPENFSHAEAAPVSNAGLTVLINLRKANIQKGQRVLIYGASGSVGTYAVQIAKYLGAEVTGVCSTSNLEMVKSLGVEKAIDYTKEDFTEQEDKYDVIFDAVGKIKFSKRKKSLKKTGIYLSALAISGNVILKAEDLEYLKNLCESGSLRTVIDRTYSIDQIVEAHKYVDKGHKKGNVVVLMSTSP
ncbi:MAG TPA: NAD(P)-dependent alcohol dehydrogenase [Ignavibacteria bacterium]|nr:NAD(P)-dependent alcohol dehydrogenase [Ignavibacteria bacterium]HMQ98776.1 NAD(P)-dependent alcohol dehydrogenase [Ignavibacteria bacterium]